MLNLSQVQSFLAVVDEGSFQTAAERLDYSQPTISLQVRKLEEFLGVQLIARNKSRSILTRDGEMFLPHARALVASAGRARDRLRQRRFTVAASSNIGVYLAPRLLTGFNTVHADDAKIALKIGTNRETIDSLLSGEADVALTEWSEPHGNVRWHAWRREKLVVIVSPDHPLASERRVPRQRLLDFPMLGGETGTGTGRIIRDFLGKDADRLMKGMQLGSTAAVKEAVKANLGISIVLAYSVSEDVAFGSLVSIELEDAEFYKSLQVGLQAEVPETSLAHAFVAFLSSQTT
ncbi:MAG: LysR family transcriptional regulator [Bradyrhizobium sp.]|uniref:LysR family transcriptional regulator n=1 Tax=Bradyrhizobium sp. TaxID=376 RepID=UPI0029AAD9C6|nr:LysR family transcriptional regulator [Bradyrhizobium sp.]MDX3969532.1 LysR family transcriptional regulator [Bradyrhizobium sp.]